MPTDSLSQFPDWWGFRQKLPERLDLQARYLVAGSNCSLVTGITFGCFHPTMGFSRRQIGFFLNFRPKELPATQKYTIALTKIYFSAMSRNMVVTLNFQSLSILSWCLNVNGKGPSAAPNQSASDRHRGRSLSTRCRWDQEHQWVSLCHNWNVPRLGL